MNVKIRSKKVLNKATINLTKIEITKKTREKSSNIETITKNIISGKTTDLCKNNNIKEKTIITQIKDN